MNSHEQAFKRAVFPSSSSLRTIAFPTSKYIRQSNCQSESTGHTETFWHGTRQQPAYLTVDQSPNSTAYIRRVNSRLVPLVSTCRAPNYLGFIIPDRNCSKLCVASVHLDLLAGSSLAPLRGFITGSDGRVSPRHLRHPRLSALCLNYIMTTNLEEISRTNIFNTTYSTGLA